MITMNKLVLFCGLLLSSGVIAEEAKPPSNSQSSLADSVTYDSSLTYFYQHASEINDSSEHGLKFDLKLDINLHKLGMLDHAKLTLHGEANGGHSINGRGGILMPVNMAMAYPGESGSDRSDLSSIYLTQGLSKNSALLLGKINMFEHAIRRGSGGAGLDYYMNTALVAAPTGFVPPTIFGGLYVKKTQDYSLTLGLYDSDDWVNRFDLENAFENGANVLVGWNKHVSFGGKRGTQGFKVAYSTADGVDLDELNLALLNGSPIAAKKESRQFIAYTFGQFLHQPQGEKSDEGFAVFGQIGVSDGNPSTLDRHIVIGVGGNNLTESRPQDRWGIGYYRYSVSDPIVDALASLSIPTRNESALEVFYNFQITENINLTADVQYVKPVLKINDEIYIYGLRLKAAL